MSTLEQEGHIAPTPEASPAASPDAAPKDVSAPENPGTSPEEISQLLESAQAVIQNAERVIEAGRKIPGGAIYRSRVEALTQRAKLGLRAMAVAGLTTIGGWGANKALDTGYAKATTTAVSHPTETTPNASTQTHTQSPSTHEAAGLNGREFPPVEDGLKARLAQEMSRAHLDAEQIHRLQHFADRQLITARLEALRALHTELQGTPLDIRDPANEFQRIRFQQLVSEKLTTALTPTVLERVMDSAYPLTAGEIAHARTGLEIYTRGANEAFAQSPQWQAYYPSV